MTTRSPYVAGYFYPSKAKDLVDFFNRELTLSTEKKPAKGILVPHAGYIYSGKTAAKTFSQVELTRTVIIIGPNHSGVGVPFSLMPKGLWETPLGKVPIDDNLANLLLKGPYFEADEEAHRSEHAIEVQIPFLQHLRPDIRFVPITLGTIDTKSLKEAGAFVGKVLTESKERVLLIASSDMNHYENERQTLDKDQAAIDAMLEVDEEKLARVVRERKISMCGFVAAYMMLVAIKILGAMEGRLVEHTTSGRTSGDYERVVGYAGMIFS